MLNFFARIAALSVIICGVFYTSSVAYYGGYLQIFGVDSDILHRNVDQILYHGFLFIYPKVFTVAIVWSFLTLFVMFIMFTVIHIKYSRKFNNISPRLRGIMFYDFSGLLVCLKSWSIFPFIFGTVLVLYLLILRNFEIDGRQTGNNVKHAIETGNVFKLQCIQRLGDKNNFEKEKLVINIFCGSDTCVGTPLNSRSYIYYDAKNIIISKFDDNSRCGLYPNNFRKMKDLE